MKTTVAQANSREGGTVFRAGLSHAASSAAAGFLLSAGMAGGALSAGWSMTALLSEPVGPLCAALLFGIGCAAVCQVKNSCPPAATDAALWLTAAACALCGTEILRLSMVIIALLLTDGRRHGIWRLILFVAAAVPGFTGLPDMPPENMLRLQAVCGCLASAGMSGAALSSIASGESALSLSWLIAGAAAGML